MIDKNDPKQVAEAYRMAVEFLDSYDYSHNAMPILDLKNQANKLDPPYKPDRSLLGWVMIIVDSKEGVYWAEYDGLYEFRVGHRYITWDAADYRGYKVTPLRVLQPDEVAVSNELFDAWRGLCFGIDWNKGTHASIHRGDIERLMSEEIKRMEAK